MWLGLYMNRAAADTEMVLSSYQQKVTYFFLEPVIVFTMLIRDS